MPCSLAASTNIAAVEMLKVWAPSPPVPHRSTRCAVSGNCTGVANSRITCAAAAISPTVRPSCFLSSGFTTETTIAFFAREDGRAKVSAPLAKAYCTITVEGKPLTFTFYLGFASRVTHTPRGGQEMLVYQQQEVFRVLGISEQEAEERRLRPVPIRCPECGGGVKEI